MQARCFCPEHGKQDFDNIVIKNGTPLCKRCMKTLEFGKVMPRAVESPVAGMHTISKAKIKAKSKSKTDGTSRKR